MINWIREVLSVRADAAPDGVRTIRDDMGRITSVSATLGGPERPPSTGPMISEALASALPAGHGWIDTANMRLAREHHVGSETTFLLDQDRGVLTLGFDDGSELVLPAQILATWSGSDGGFLWSWANPSIQPHMSFDAASMRDRDIHDVTSPYTVPNPNLAYGDTVAVMGMACRDAGADGLYRCINGGVQVFASIRIPPAAQPAAAMNQQEVDEVMDVMRRYDAGMFELDQSFAGRQDDVDELRRVVDLKQAVHDRFWTRTDSYWDPSSVGWPSDHDQQSIRLRFTAPHRQEGILYVTVMGILTRIHHLRRIGGELRIVDQLLDWGDGFVWMSTD